MKVGFACAWKKMPEKTWSGTPWGLRSALGRQTDVVDLGVEYSAAQAFSKYLYARRRQGRWGSVYDWSPGRDRMLQRKLRSSLRKKPVDAVVEVGDLAWLDAPFYVYKDLSFAVLEKYYDPKSGAPGFNGIDLDSIKYRKERQHKLWESATSIFAMSEWLADALVEMSGVPRHKITVVYAGLNSFVETVDSAAVEPASAEPVKLLFVGRDFFRKGGDIVLKALAQLRHEYSRSIQLTVAGPENWPLSGEVPEGVVFLGGRTTAEVARLYREHDLFVMPSRFEAFGMVFPEALAHGVPVIGRAAFAMPEIIEPGKNGALVYSDDPAELASTIAAVLEDISIREYTARTAKDTQKRFSWDTVAGRMVAAMEAAV